MKESFVLIIQRNKKWCHKQHLKRKWSSNLFHWKWKCFYFRSSFDSLWIGSSAWPACPWFQMPIAWAIHFDFDWFTEGQTCVAKVILNVFFARFFFISFTQTSIKYSSCHSIDANVADDVLLLQKEHKTCTENFQFRPRICIYYRFADK